MSDTKAIFMKGIIKDNPVFVMLLGMCPTLGVTSTSFNGLGMGIATLFVLVMSNIVVSLIKNIVPDKVRIPAFIVVIASFVTIVEMVLEAYIPFLYDQLGIFIPLIVVNCVILGRAEAFASKNGVLASVLDALGMSIGFGIALMLMSSVREILGSGTWLGMKVLGSWYIPWQVMILPAGAFFVLGFLIWGFNSINKAFKG